jgi:phosphomannomutase
MTSADRRRQYVRGDAFAIGRCFGSIVARNGGSTVAVGYDAVVQSSFEAAPPRAQCQRHRGGPHRPRSDPDAVLCLDKLATDGAVMVTGSHNPPTTTASR